MKKKRKMRFFIPFAVGKRMAYMKGRRDGEDANLSLLTDSMLLTSCFVSNTVSKYLSFRHSVERKLASTFSDEIKEANKLLSDYELLSEADYSSSADTALVKAYRLSKAKERLTEIAAEIRASISVGESAVKKCRLRLEGSLTSYMTGVSITIPEVDITKNSSIAGLACEQDDLKELTVPGTKELFEFFNKS